MLEVLEHFNSNFIITAAVCIYLILVFFIIAKIIYLFCFKRISGKHKFAKLSEKDDVEYMVNCIRNAEEVLNSEEFSNKLAFHNKRLREIITMADKKGYQKKYKKLRPKLAIIEYEARQCKKRIEELMKMSE